MGALGALLSASEGLNEFQGSYFKGQAARQQGDYQKSMMDINADIAEFQASDATRRGDVAAQQHLRKSRQVLGSQRAALAAQGVDIGSGSAAQIQEDTQVLAAEDAQTIRNNAWREAWGFKVQAEDYRAKGAYAEMAGRHEQTNSLISGAGKLFASGIKAAGNLSSMSSPSSTPSVSSGRQSRTMVSKGQKLTMDNGY